MACSTCDGGQQMQLDRTIHYDNVGYNGEAPFAEFRMVEAQEKEDKSSS